MHSQDASHTPHVRDRRALLSLLARVCLAEMCGSIGYTVVMPHFHLKHRHPNARFAHV
jgi:hypothetical protein